MISLTPNKTFVKAGMRIHIEPPMKEAISSRNIYNVEFCIEEFI